MSENNDSEEPSSEALAAPESKNGKKKGGMAGAASAVVARPHVILRVLLGTAGLFLLVGFFLPWISLGELTDVSGLRIVISDDLVLAEGIGDLHRRLLGAVPLLGLVLTAFGFMGVRGAGIVGALIGLVLVGFGLVTVAILFFQMTGIGLWFTLGGALLASASGLLALIRGRATGGAPPTIE